MAGKIDPEAVLALVTAAVEVVKIAKPVVEGYAPKVVAAADDAPKVVWKGARKFVGSFGNIMSLLVPITRVRPKTSRE